VYWCTRTHSLHPPPGTREQVWLPRQALRQLCTYASRCNSQGLPIGPDRALPRADDAAREPGVGDPDTGDLDTADWVTGDLAGAGAGETALDDEADLAVLRVLSAGLTAAAAAMAIFFLSAGAAAAFVALSHAASAAVIVGAAVFVFAAVVFVVFPAVVFAAVVFVAGGLRAPTSAAVFVDTFVIDLAPPGGRASLDVPLSSSTFASW